MLLSSLGTSISNVALPGLADAFSATLPSVQWIVLAYLIALTSAVVSTGHLGDLLGRRRLLLCGIALFILSSLLCALAPTLELLIAARAVQGLAAAVMMALSVALAAEAPSRKAGAAMGLLGTMSAAGTGLGPLLGGILLDAFGWRAIYLVMAPLGTVALLLTRQMPVAVPAPKTEAAAFDFRGAFLLTASLAAYALALSVGGSGRLNLSLAIAAALGAAAFLWAETRAPSPLIRPALLRDPVLRGALVTSGLVAAVMMAMMVVAPFYLSRGLGLRAALVGAILSTGPLVPALTAAPAGRVVDRVGARRMAASGLVAILAACSSLAVVPTRLGVPGFMVPVLLMTFGYAVFQTSNNVIAMAGADPGQRGVVSGILSLSRNLGLITGASVAGVVFAWGSGTSDVGTTLPHAAAAGLHATFALAAMLIVAALAISGKGSDLRADKAG